MLSQRSHPSSTVDSPAIAVRCGNCRSCIRNQRTNIGDLWRGRWTPPRVSSLLFIRTACCGNDATAGMVHGEAGWAEPGDARHLPHGLQPHPSGGRGDAPPSHASDLTVASPDRVIYAPMGRILPNAPSEAGLDSARGVCDPVAVAARVSCRAEAVAEFCPVTLHNRLKLESPQSRNSEGALPAPQS